MQWAGLMGCEGSCGSHTDAPSRPSCCSELSTSMCLSVLFKWANTTAEVPVPSPGLLLLSPSGLRRRPTTTAKAFKSSWTFPPSLLTMELHPRSPRGSRICVFVHPPWHTGLHPKPPTHQPLHRLCPLLHDGLCIAGPITSLLERIPLGPYLLSQEHSISDGSVCFSSAGLQSPKKRNTGSARPTPGLG